MACARPPRRRRRRRSGPHQNIFRPLSLPLTGGGGGGTYPYTQEHQEQREREREHTCAFFFLSSSSSPFRMLFVVGFFCAAQLIIVLSISIDKRAHFVGGRQEEWPFRYVVRTAAKGMGEEEEEEGVACTGWAPCLAGLGATYSPVRSKVGGPRKTTYLKLFRSARYSAPSPPPFPHCRHHDHRPGPEVEFAFHLAASSLPP